MKNGRPRQPDYENRIRRFAGGPALGKRFGGEGLDASVDRMRDFARPVTLALAAKRVRLSVMGEGLLGPPGVVQRLAEREIEMEAIVGG